MKKLMFAAALVSASMLVAQEMAEAELVAETDQGEAIAAQCVDTTEEAPANEFVSAADLVSQALEERGLFEGYDPEKNATIQIGTAQIKIEDPANDKTFMTVRTLKAAEAYLAAKVAIIQSINTDFSAMDRATMTYQDGKDEVQEAYEAKMAELEATKALLVEKFAQFNEAEANALEGVTIGDRFGAILEGIAKRLDSAFSSEKILAEKRALRDEIAAQVELLTSQYVELKKQADAMPKVPDNEIESAAQAFAKMPLLGSTVLTQAESWDATEKIYSVSMAVVWSPKLQAVAEALTTGQEVAAGKGGIAPKDWIKKQDLAVMVGPRSFTDPSGKKVFVGIAAADLTGPVSQMASKKRLADMNARKAVAFSLTSDVQSAETARQVLREYGDKKAVMEEMTTALQQKCDINLQGCMKLTSKELKHPITGRKTYVSVFYVDPQLNKNAQDLLEKAYSAAGRQTKATQYRRGRHAGAEAALDKTRKSKAEFNRGKAEVEKTVTEEINAKPKSVSRGAAGSKRTAAEGKSQGGSFSNANDVDMDF